jgi:stage V sporulation protein G
MRITEVRIFPKGEEKLKAYAAITFDDVFVVHNLRIVQGEKGLMVCMPSRKKNDGTFKDIAHPITNEFRHELEQVVLQAFDAKLKEIQVAGSDGTSAAMTDSL